MYVNIYYLILTGLLEKPDLKVLIKSAYLMVHFLKCFRNDTARMP